MTGYAELFNEAERLRSDGKIPEALSCYTGYLRLYLTGLQDHGLPARFDINDFYVLDRFVDLSMLTGKNKAAEHALSAMILLATQVGNTGIRIHAVSRLCLVHLDQGRTDEAGNDVQKLSDVIGDVRSIRISPTGLASWEQEIRFGPTRGLQDEKDRLVCLYDMLGSLLLAMGRYSEGILMLDNGIRTGEKYPSPLVESRLMPMKLLLAKAHFENGEPARANDWMIALGVSAPAAAAVSGIPLQYLELRSRIAMAQGRLGEAYKDMVEIAQLCRRHRLPLAAIKANFNLAKLKVQLNQVKEATQLMEDSLHDALGAGEHALASRIRQYLNIAERRAGASIPILTYTGRRASFSAAGSSKGHFPIEEKEKKGRAADYFAAYEEGVLLFQLHLSANHPGKAAELFSQLRLSASRSDSRYIQMHLEIQELLFLQGTGAPIPADYPYREILEFYESAQLLPALWQLRQLLVHGPLVSEKEKGVWVVENQRLLDRMTASLPPEMQTLYLLNKWSPNEEYLAALSNDLLQGKHTARAAKPIFRRWRLQWRQMIAVHGFQENASRYKDHLAREICKGDRPDSFDFSSRQKGALKKLWRQPFHSLTICFLVLPDRVVIVSRSFLRLRVDVSFVSRIALRQLVFDIRDRLYPRSVTTRSIDLSFTPPAGNSTPVGELSQALSEILQLEKIILAHGRSFKQLILVPDDVLHGFPFNLFTHGGALFTHAGVAALFGKMAVTISVDDRVAKRSPLHLRGKEALLAGISKGIPGVEDLPAVPEEIRRIRETLTGYGANVRVVAEQDATLQTVTQGLKRADLAHFACHGFFDYREPDHSGLLMAGGEMLTLRELLSLEGLSGVEMAVLSSCRGAEHFILPGRWIIGLPETLCRAGVQTVVAFLWPVNDSFALAFTTKFYAYLESSSPAVALQRTLSDAVNKRLMGVSVEYWLPQYWAAVTLYQR